MKKIFFLLFLPLFLYSSIRVSTTYPFEEFFIKKIGQEYIDIDTISNIYTQKEENLLYSKKHRLAKNKIFFHFNLNIEQEYSRILKNTNNKLLIVDMSKNINKLKSNNKDNPYVWMDPLLVRDISKNIYEALINVDPRNTAYYKKNYNYFLNELDEIFLKIKAQLYKSEIYNLFIYDDYWDYFMERFDINTFKIEKKYLFANKINDLNSFIDKNDIKAILISDNDSYSMAKSLSTPTNIMIKRHDIFSDMWAVNIIKLSRGFSK